MKQKYSAPIVEIKSFDDLTEEQKKELAILIAQEKEKRNEKRI